jgi:hypothetical protein
MSEGFSATWHQFRVSLSPGDVASLNQITPSAARTFASVRAG